MDNLLQPNQASTPVDPALIHSLVPLKDMSKAHVNELLEFAQTEYLYQGQTLFNRGAIDNCHLYLLYGDLLLESECGVQQVIKGRSSLLPIAHCKPRQQQATALTDCAVLRIESNTLDKLLTWSQVADYLHSIIARDRDLDEDVQWMMQVLHSNLFFKVSPLNVDEVFSQMESTVVDTGEVILRQGELGDRCYFIKEGVAHVTRQGETGNEFVAEIHQGRCFGEDALVNDAPRNATVTMATDGVLMYLRKQEFYRLIKAPDVPTVPLSQAIEYVNDLPQVLVDVRSDEEYAVGHLHQAVNIPLHLLGIKSRLLRIGVEYICYCDTGRRSQAATHLLREQGFMVKALANCEQVFEGCKDSPELEVGSNYVLREGYSKPGH
ncbi:cyclic nucleotide-binding domain-containing protein [Gilvimarinus agarilyticus]|uniref:cyclic nucleotide-binding domain-containing protein n=1 Tax=unclassified Gilvimarinus TaxID=2642066 RepID=UPI001C09C174|nr:MULTISPECIES: cyclic nucleotide-binding domain-containing protein [unclassified Gilvimarinus]MBU2887150.1 cyclic nucleotide-binding domain-containing protein [Gilvimarinus agarilyticus]MDO6571809.1 cyclic nucleotide-binding domain-containing protein [Gilvimarinus sp. 2_MG-2023]MDO6745882.1 cyclic nucleotide-binding domain-containing protein [Gilvimarinus sp. 1_MG-2023]